MTNVTGRPLDAGPARASRSRSGLLGPARGLDVRLAAVGLGQAGAGGLGLRPHLVRAQAEATGPSLAEANGSQPDAEPASRSKKS